MAMDMDALNAQLKMWLNSFQAVTVTTRFEVLELHRIGGWVTVLKVLENKSGSGFTAGQEFAGSEVELFVDDRDRGTGKMSVRLKKDEDVVFQTKSHSDNIVRAIAISIG